jgi:HEAT repeat protein
MKDERPAISRQAMLSAGNSQDPGFVKLLLTFLPDTLTRPVVQKALSRYEPLVLLPILEEMSQDPEAPHEIILQLPSLASAMETQLAIDFLFEFLKKRDPVLKREALDALQTLKSKFPHLVIHRKRIVPLIKEEAGWYKDTLALQHTAIHYWKGDDEDSTTGVAAKELIFLLERRLDNILERMFMILSLAKPHEVILPLYQDVHHPDPQSRINLVELLDNILEPVVKKDFIPILEAAILDTGSDDILIRLDLGIHSEIDFFESLLKGEDGLLKLAVLNLLEALNNPDYNHQIVLVESDAYPSVRIRAEKLMEKE